jgi:hypothetical protein
MAAIDPLAILNKEVKPGPGGVRRANESVTRHYMQFGNQFEFSHTHKKKQEFCFRKKAQNQYCVKIIAYSAVVFGGLLIFFETKLRFGQMYSFD